MEKVKRTKVVDLLKSTAYGSIVNVKGWVRTHRSSKAVDFIALNDGSTINNIQIVVDPSKVDENQLRQITTGACISAVGTLVESQVPDRVLRFSARASRFTVSAAATILCRRRDRASNTCVSMLTSVSVPIPLVP